MGHIVICDALGTGTSPGLAGGFVLNASKQLIVTHAAMHFQMEGTL